MPNPAKGAKRPMVKIYQSAIQKGIEEDIDNNTCNVEETKLKSLEKISHIISSICSKQKAVLAAYIFGSVAKKDNRKPGDIDIAVLLDDKHSQSFSVLSFISTLEKTIGNRVDLVILNRAGEVLKYEVRRSGIIVFERSPEARKKFEIYCRKTYEDFLYLHKRYVNKVLYGGKSG